MKRIATIAIICGIAHLAFSQNFGIDQSNPTEKLDVNGNIKAAGSIIAESGEFISSGVNCSSTRDNFPPGISYFVPSASDAACPYSYGNIVTINAGNCRTTQIFTGKNSAGVWYRGENCGPWGPWVSLNNGVSAGTSSDPLTSTSQADGLNMPSGYYYFNFPGSTGGPVQLYFQSSMSGGVGYVRVFSSPYNGTATVNFVGYSFPWTRFLVQTADGPTVRAVAIFSTSRLFNTSNSTVTSTGGTHVGYRVYIGYAGGMGIYNTAQAPCNWGNSSGAVGAGWNGSTCGSFPNGLLWGTGTGSATYTAYNTVWDIWIAN